MDARRTRFYLDKRNKKLMGVCAGVADYFGVEPIWIRLGFMFTLFFLFPPIIFAYFAMGWFADPKPAALYNESADEREFWTQVRVAPQRTVRDVRASFRESDRRLQDIEAYMTSTNSRLASEIDRLR